MSRSMDDSPGHTTRFPPRRMFLPQKRMISGSFGVFFIASSSFSLSDTLSAAASASGVMSSVATPLSSALLSSSFVAVNSAKPNPDSGARLKIAVICLREKSPWPIRALPFTMERSLSCGNKKPTALVMNDDLRPFKQQRWRYQGIGVVHSQRKLELLLTLVECGAKIISDVALKPPATL